MTRDDLDSLSERMCALSEKAARSGMLLTVMAIQIALDDLEDAFESDQASVPNDR